MDSLMILSVIALDFAFTKIFISASLQPTKNPSSILHQDSKTIVAKPEFPKIKKNSSVLLPDLEIRK